MPSPAGAAAKICAICGQDCSNKPRTKDRKGQYYCRTCYDQALRQQRAGQPVHAAPKPAPPPPPDDRLDADDDSDPFAAMAALAPTEPLVAQESSACPGCGANLAFTALVCSRCGYDKRTGEKGFQHPAGAPAGAPAARPAKARSASVGGAAAGIKAPWIIFVVPAAVFAVLVLLGRASVGFALLFIVLWVFTAFIVNILVLYHAFRESVLTGILCLFIGPYNLYFALAKMDAPRTKNALYAVLLGVLLIFLLPKVSEDELSAGDYGEERVDEYADDEPDEYPDEYTEPVDADAGEVSWSAPERFTDVLALSRSHHPTPLIVRSGHPLATDDVV